MDRGFGNWISVGQSAAPWARGLVALARSVDIMPLHIDDDAETALIEVAAIFALYEGEFTTGEQVSQALRDIAADLHAVRMRFERLKAERS